MSGSPKEWLLTMLVLAVTDSAWPHALPRGGCCRGEGGPPPLGQRLGDMWQAGQSTGNPSPNYYNITIPATIVINYNGSLSASTGLSSTAQGGSPPPNSAQGGSSPPSTQGGSPPPNGAQRGGPPPNGVKRDGPPPNGAQGGGPPPISTQGGGPPPNGAQRDGPPPNGAQGGGPPLNGTQGGSLPPNGAQRGGPPPNGTQGGSPPPNGAQRGGPPPNGTQGGSPPPNGTQGGSSPPNDARPSGPSPGASAPGSTSNDLPVALPSGSIILYNGNVRFPNNTVLLTKYGTNAALPVARLPSGTLMFSNGTKVAAGTVSSFPPPGVPLNATEEATVYPSVVLPAGSLVFRNGSVASPGLSLISTTFVKGVVPTCDGVTCHYSTA